MRIPALCFLLAACGGSPKPAPEAPPAAASLLTCDQVATHVAATVNTTPLRSGATYEAVAGMVATRCKADGWSDETRRCLHGITTVAEGRACATSMTDAQRTAIRTQARSLRADAAASAAADDPSADWIEHVVQDRRD